MKKLPLVVIAGPTASGKTALSIEIAKLIGGEIVSADSMQIYKYMNIATAKPTEEEKQGIAHHLMDFLEPTVAFSVSDYCEKAKKAISDICKRNRIPIVAGGTGLYIDSLVNGVDFGEMPEDRTVREELLKLAETDGKEAVHKILEEIDPETAEKYHPNNLRRVVRAIEFYRVTGQTISAHAAVEKESPYNYVYFCIDWNRAELYDRINRRVDIMFEQGLEDEARTVLNMGMESTSTAMQSIGYKELFSYFNGQRSFDEAVEEIKRNTRRYAKRQLTWFRRNENIVWLDPKTDMVKTAVEIINKKIGLTA